MSLFYVAYPTIGKQDKRLQTPVIPGGLHYFAHVYASFVCHSVNRDYVPVIIHLLLTCMAQKLFLDNDIG